MLKITLRILKDRLLIISIYVLAGIAVNAMFASIFLSFKDQGEEFAQVFDAYPAGFMEAFGISDMSRMLTDFHTFIAVENFSIIWPIMAIAVVLGFAGATIAGEIERGSIELLLSEPISRLKIFMSKYLAGLIMLSIFAFVTVMSAIPIAALFNIEYIAINFWKLFVLSLFFGWALLGMSMFFSALMSERGKVYFSVSAIMIVMYAIKIVAGLKESLEWLQYTSFIYYYNFTDTLADGELSALALTVLGLSAIGFSVLAAYWFDRRDIATS